MKKILLISCLFSALVSSSQLTWQLSNSGMLPNYRPVHMTLAPNGNVYMLCDAGPNASSFTKLTKSTDGGNSWTEVTVGGLPNNLNPTGILSVANKLFLIAYENYGVVYESLDNGLNWTLVSTGLPSNYIFTQIKAGANNTIYLAGRKVSSSSAAILAKSTDNGITWTDIPISLGQNVNALGFANGKILIATSDLTEKNCLNMYSTDEGQNWSGTSGLPCVTRDFIESNGEIFAVCDNTSKVSLHSSTDGAVTFNQIAISGLTNMTRASGLLKVSDKILMCGWAPLNSTNYIYSTTSPTDLAEKELQSMNLFPNPVADFLNIDIHAAPNYSDKHIKIFSMTGQLMKELSTQQKRVNVTDLLPGVYQIHVLMQDASYCNRLVKIN